MKCNQQPQQKWCLQLLSNFAVPHMASRLCWKVLNLFHCLREVSWWVIWCFHLWWQVGEQKHIMQDLHVTISKNLLISEFDMETDSFDSFDSKNPKFEADPEFWHFSICTSLQVGKVLWDHGRHCGPCRSHQNMNPGAHVLATCAIFADSTVRCCYPRIIRCEGWKNIRCCFQICSILPATQFWSSPSKAGGKMVGGQLCWRSQMHRLPQPISFTAM